MIGALDGCTGFYDHQDWRIWQGWRLQAHVSGKRYRVVDPWWRRRAEGSDFTEVAAFFDAHARPSTHPDWQALEAGGTAVVLLHGIGRTRLCMERLAGRLRHGAHGAQRPLMVLNVGYPSTRQPIEASAHGLAQLAGWLPPATRLLLVGYSMGGLVARAWLAQRAPEATPRVARLITLGTPHEGASRADVYRDWWLYRKFFGPAGQQLTTTHAAGEPWPWPAGVPVTAIAGSRAPHGYHPWIPGDDDGTVELASASPPEADEAFLISRTHTFLMSHPQVAATILHYALADNSTSEA